MLFIQLLLEGVYMEGKMLKTEFIIGNQKWSYLDLKILQLVSI